MALAGGFVVYMVKELAPVVKIKFTRGGGVNPCTGECPDKVCQASIKALVQKSDERAAAVNEMRDDLKEIFKRMGIIEQSVAYIKGRLK